MVVKPLIDYYLRYTNFKLLIVDRDMDRARYVAGNNPAATAVYCEAQNTKEIKAVIKHGDLVISLLPPSFHFNVAEICLQLKKSLVTTSYLTVDIQKLSRAAKDLGLIFLNEAGEDPGLDHMETMRLIETVLNTGGKILRVMSLAGGLPADKDINPFSYKFSWRPEGLISAANQNAVYLDRGSPISVSAIDLFKDSRLQYLRSIGKFETYPNRNCLKYLSPYKLDSSITFYRGILRYPGWCETMDKLKTLGFFDDTTVFDFTGMTWSDFVISLTGIDTNNAHKALAKFFNIEQDHEFLAKISWLGLLQNSLIPIKEGTRAGILIELMKGKFIYQKGEKDKSIVYIEVTYLLDAQEKTINSLLVVDGTAPDQSAMAKAVGLPAAIAGKLIVEGNIKFRGVCIPTLKEIYLPVLNEMRHFGIEFKTNCISI